MEPLLFPDTVLHTLDHREHNRGEQPQTSCIQQTAVRACPRKGIGDRLTGLLAIHARMCHASTVQTVNAEISTPGPAASRRPARWLTVALVAQVASGVVGFVQDGAIGTSLVTSAGVGVVLLPLVRRRQERAWYAFVTLNAVGLTLVAIALVWALVNPALHLEISWHGVALTVVSIGAVLAPGVRPDPAAR